MNKPKREFHYEDGKSDKFWTIELKGDKHLLNWGRAGTLGQYLEKNFESVVGAQFEYEKIVAEKIKKGYVEVAIRKPTNVPNELPPHVRPTKKITADDLVEHGFYVDVLGAVHHITDLYDNGEIRYVTYDSKGQAQRSGILTAEKFARAALRRVKPKV
jgi:predicted DNA-binding WGR domain protein